MNLSEEISDTERFYTGREITYTIDLAADLEGKEKAGEVMSITEARNIALILEKQAQEHVVPSACHDLGMFSLI